MTRVWSDYARGDEGEPHILLATIDRGVEEYPKYVVWGSDKHNTRVLYAEDAEDENYVHIGRWVKNPEKMLNQRNQRMHAP